jgi:hypothetical protein
MAWRQAVLTDFFTLPFGLARQIPGSALKQAATASFHVQFIDNPKMGSQ